MLTQEAFAQVSEWYCNNSPSIMRAPGFGIDKYRIPYLDSLSAVHRMLFDECSAEGLVMYPWFPVGEYFVELGNPRTQIAIVFGTDEATKLKADAIQKSHGWTIYATAIPGTEGLNRAGLMDALEGCGAFDLLQTIQERHGN